MCFLRHAEHYARNRTSLAGLEKDLLFFGPPHIYLLARRFHVSWAATVSPLWSDFLFFFDLQLTHWRKSRIEWVILMPQSSGAPTFFSPSSPYANHKRDFPRFRRQIELPSWYQKSTIMSAIIFHISSKPSISSHISLSPWCKNAIAPAWFFQW